MSSFAVAVRVFDGEAPYLQSFIDHHRRIGVEAFYPVLAPGAAPLCREIFSRNGIVFHESDGQRIGSVQESIREDYVAVIDADEYLHPDLFSFLDEENIESLLMPWRLTASMNDDFFEAPQKRFFVFPQVKSIVKTTALKRLRLHASNTIGSGRCLGVAQGQQFPVQHYYLRGLDDLLLKEGGVVKRTLAQSSGRKPVKLNADAGAMDFPSRHARVAFLLNALNAMPVQLDPYRMSLDRTMLDHLRNDVEGDPEAAKQVLRDSVVKIQKVYRRSTIHREIKSTQQLLASDPCKVSYQKRVLKLLRQDFQFRRSWLGRFENARDSLMMHWT
ncbi:glycosyltransferase family 2 protein [Synechococcus sp. KORDI-52]|uniref:glycosyltransferase family 2 protein n=1 Tax=Synechococcus sp. KORDI-52 TaxID=585425 RepID=UPI00056FA541|nr:glycosyltransferase family 2 protein [Synechococcus sp. KORDI-52]